ncbi:EIF4G2 [Bugula neritina]|uniref:Eukaryotic translation initiation factor 4 gamma 2 n=1 Tax=Bugula neritina TaxID=10212 RepID=A0A7J7JU21_BUGNE|nr:EIF4G2 [Bugula neritina]
MYMYKVLHRLSGAKEEKVSSRLNYYNHSGRTRQSRGYFFYAPQRHRLQRYIQDALFSQPAQVPSTSHRSVNVESRPWVAPSTRRHAVGAAAGHRHKKDVPLLTNETVFHKARGILNKLTPERFDKLCLELLNVGIDSEPTLRGLIILIFDKAVDEPKFSSLYAQLCERLSKDAPNFEAHSNKLNTFYKLLLTKCQDEFENRTNITSALANLSFRTDEEKDEFAKIKRKMLGNIRFIGELGKLAVVSQGILHKCIQQLLEKKRGLSLSDQAEDLECLCQIMKTVGKRLDTPQAKPLMDQYFARMASVQESGDMPSRIRFMLLDVMDMRKNSWKPRSANRELIPQTINQIRQSFPHHNAETMLFNSQLSAPSKGVDGDLFDIFGAPMAVKGVGGGTSNKQSSFRPSSPSNLRQHQQRQEPSLGWRDNNVDRSDRTSRDRRDRDMFVEKDQPHREIKDIRERPDSGRGRDFQNRVSNKPLSSSLAPSDKISLRPGSSLSKSQNLSLKPSSPHQLPKSARSNNFVTSESVREPPIFTKPPTPVIIKQESKPKSRKQTETKVISNGDADKPSELTRINKAISACENLCTVEDPETVCNAVLSILENSARLKAKDLHKIIKQEFNNTNITSLLAFHSLFKCLLSAGCLNSGTIEQVLMGLVEEIPKLEAKHPDVRKQVADLLSLALSSSLVAFDTVLRALVGGVCHPLALEILQSLHTKQGEEWLSLMLTTHKLSCFQFLPGNLQSDDEALIAMERYDLFHYQPMLVLQKQLWQQLVADPNPATFFKWIMKNIDGKYLADDDFTRVLFRCLLKYVVCETSLKEGIDKTVLPGKSVQDDEKRIFTNYKDIMLRFLHASHSRQVSAIYALQVFCYENNFPKGMMLRVFTYLYDLEIVDEEVFLQWKEDINEDYPGKGKALFQVNQWLTWLEQAESESDDDEA